MSSIGYVGGSVCPATVRWQGHVQAEKTKTMHQFYGGQSGANVIQWCR